MRRFFLNNDLGLPFVFVLFVTSIIFYGIFLRSYDLGYSNFQGDEADTLDYLASTSSKIDFLLQQKKGPVQYIVNMANTEIFGYVSEFQIRFPYMLFGILAIGFIGFLSYRIYGKESALLSMAVLSLNGLFISFSRITQYQSIMYFLMSVCALLFLKATESRKIFYYILSGLTYGLMLLTHYDAVTMLPFFAVIVFFDLFRSKNNGKNVILSIILFLFVSFLIASIFYIPYFISSFFGTSTQTYMESRLTGGGFMPRTRSTFDLLSLYMPRWYMVVIFLLSIAGIYFSIKEVSSKKIKIAVVIALFGLVFSVIFSFFPIKPRLSSLMFFLFSIIAILAPIFDSRVDYKKIALATWFLGSFFVYFFVVKDPRTHVYMSIIPGIVLIGYGISSLYALLLSKYRIISYSILILVSFAFLYLVGLYYVMYFDKSTEYPWWEKTYLGRSLFKIEKSKRIDGVFGFNQYRGWEQIKDLYKKGCLVGTFESNEKEPITDFYIGFSQLYGDSWNTDKFSIKPSTLIVVEAPHSWIYEQRRKFTDYTMLDTLKTRGVPVTYLYGHKDVYIDGKYKCQ